MTDGNKSNRRLDQLLLERGVFDSRVRARAAIENGLVRVDGNVVVKPSKSIQFESVVETAGDVHPYVSRGGIKLAAALAAMNIDASGKICLDLGASTGGFSDVLLQAGAKKIYAVDVGRGQLHSKIAAEPRVINLEAVNAKDISPAQIPDTIDLIVCDVSFISLKKATPAALNLAAPGAKLIALVKPQFEVGPSRIGKGGLIKPGYENSWGVAQELSAWIADQNGWTSLGYMQSPIRGGSGAQEFLLGGLKTA